jgi:hypothetical protein
VEYRYAWEVLERAVYEIEVITGTAHAWIGMEAWKHRVLESLPANTERLQQQSCELRLKARLPDGFDAFAEVVEDMAALDTATGRQETADDAGDVTADVERLRIINPDTFYTKTETSYTWKDYSLPLGKSLLQDVL